jgi:hypothetical protein
MGELIDPVPVVEVTIPKLLNVTGPTEHENPAVS